MGAKRNNDQDDIQLEGYMGQLLAKAFIFCGAFCLLFALAIWFFGGPKHLLLPITASGVLCLGAAIAAFAATAKRLEEMKRAQVGAKEQRKKDRTAQEKADHQEEVDRLRRETAEEQEKIRLAEARRQRESIENPESPDRKQEQRYISRREIDIRVSAFEEVQGPALTDLEREKTLERVISQIQGDSDLSTEAKQRLITETKQRARQLTNRNIDLFKD